MWRLGNSRVDWREKGGGGEKSLYGQGREEAEFTRKNASGNKSRAREGEGGEGDVE